MTVGSLNLMCIYSHSITYLNSHFYSYQRISRIIYLQILREHFKDFGKNSQWDSSMARIQNHKTICKPFVSRKVLRIIFKSFIFSLGFWAYEDSYSTLLLWIFLFVFEFFQSNIVLIICLRLKSILSHKAVFSHHMFGSHGLTQLRNFMPILNTH